MSPVMVSLRSFGARDRRPRIAVAAVADGRIVSDVRPQFTHFTSDLDSAAREAFPMDNAPGFSLSGSSAEIVPNGESRQCPLVPTSVLTCRFSVGARGFEPLASSASSKGEHPPKPLVTVSDLENRGQQPSLEFPDSICHPRPAVPSTFRQHGSHGQSLRRPTIPSLWRAPRSGGRGRGVTAPSPTAPEPAQN